MREWLSSVWGRWRDLVEVASQWSSSLLGLLNDALLWSVGHLPRRWLILMPALESVALASIRRRCRENVFRQRLLDQWLWTAWRQLRWRHPLLRQRLVQWNNQRGRLTVLSRSRLLSTNHVLSDTFSGTPRLVIIMILYSVDQTLIFYTCIRSDLTISMTLPFTFVGISPDIVILSVSVELYVGFPRTVRFTQKVHWPEETERVTSPYSLGSAYVFFVRARRTPSRFSSCCFSV